MGSLTADRVRKLVRPGRYGDGGGLYLLVKPTGSRSWTLRIQKDGMRTDKGLGGYPTVTLAVARTLAESARVKIREGEKPMSRTERRERTAEVYAADVEQSRTPTFREAAERYLEAVSPTWRNPRTAKMWMQSLERHVLPEDGGKPIDEKFGDKPIDEITTQEVINCLKIFWKTSPATAQKVKQRVKAVFDWAQEMGFRDSNPVGPFKATLPRQKGMVRGHHRALPYQDVPKALIHLKRHRERIDPARSEPLPWKVTLLCLEFLILTAARSGEARGARWDEIDFETATWTIPADRMKAGKAHRVPLSFQALGVLARAREELKHAGNGLVFPAPRNSLLRDNCLSTRVREDNLDCTPHGFRSSFRDWAAEKSGASREAIELSLAHAVGTTTEVAYFRSDMLDARRPLMDAWADYVDPVDSPF